MEKLKEIFKQEICGDCLQWIVNNENNHGKESFENMQNTLTDWAKQDYFPVGLSDNEDPFFSWHKCDLCNGLAGDRYEYNFSEIKE